ncbi:MAG: CDP-glycerol glycerophosphotransferase family protein [Desulfovibrio sp.]|nr:CDP-glycerol glycerophosphotransferase family protein [Desulfovibrio sp.]
MPTRSAVILLSHLPFIRRRFIGRRLLADRDREADDNAEHLCRRIMRNRPERKLFFALGKNSPDWNRLKAEGFNLINLKSLTYFFAWLHCDWLISSNRTGYIVRPRREKRHIWIIMQTSMKRVVTANRKV